MLPPPARSPAPRHEIREGSPVARSRRRRQAETGCRSAAGSEWAEARRAKATVRATGHGRPRARAPVRPGRPRAWACDQLPRRPVGRGLGGGGHPHPRLRRDHV